MIQIILIEEKDLLHSFNRTREPALNSFSKFPLPAPFEVSLPRYNIKRYTQNLRRNSRTSPSRYPQAAIKVSRKVTRLKIPSENRDNRLSKVHRKRKEGYVEAPVPSSSPSSPSSSSSSSSPSLPGSKHFVGNL